MTKIRIAAIIFPCIILISCIAYAEEPAVIDGFRGYTWGTSFEEIKADVEAEVGTDGYWIEEYNPEDLPVKNGVENTLKFHIMSDYGTVAGYDARMGYSFDDVGLFGGYYSIKFTEYETSVHQVYDDLLEKYSAVYGQPVQSGEGEEGEEGEKVYGALWVDEEKNLIYMIALSSEDIQDVQIEYFAAYNPDLSTIDREDGEEWEHNFGINPYAALNADNYSGI